MSYILKKFLAVYLQWYYHFSAPIYSNIPQNSCPYLLFPILHLLFISVRLLSPALYSTTFIRICSNSHFAKTRSHLFLVLTLHDEAEFDHSHPSCNFPSLVFKISLFLIFLFFGNFFTDSCSSSYPLTIEITQGLVLVL